MVCTRNFKIYTVHISDVYLHYLQTYVQPKVTACVQNNVLVEIIQEHDQVEDDDDDDELR